ncbi:MAG TPA: hypothetical protein VM056_02390 [Terriglobales bacterium]|nr:hypothetical protein [Terriglobales bacterium]
MNKFFSISAAALLTTALAFAQTTTAPKPAQTPATGTQPAAKQPAAQQPATGATPAEAPKTQKAPEAKSQEEFAAYQAVATQADLTLAETAADEFVKKYPASELKSAVYGALLQKHYQAGDSPKVVTVGRKLLATEPDNAMALVVTATALAETSKDTDLDHEERYAEAFKNADSALKVIETMLPQPGVTPEQFEALKTVLRAMAHSAKGYMEMNRKNYPASEENFQKAIQANPSQDDPTIYLRLAVAQDNQRKYAPAYANATKAMELAQSQNNTPVANLARSEKDRLTKLMGNPAANKPAAPAATKPATTPVPPKK